MFSSWPYTKSCLLYYCERISQKETQFSIKKKFSIHFFFILIMFFFLYLVLSNNFCNAGINVCLGDCIRTLYECRSVSRGLYARVESELFSCILC